LESKIIADIQNAANEKEKEKSIDRYVKEYYKHMNFDYPKPVENTSFSVETAQNLLTQNNSQISLP